MGANTFSTLVTGETAKEAFEAAVREARHQYGHSGYTGTIAEKDSFVMIERDPNLAPMAQIDVLISADDPRIEDKHGPAGCLKIDATTWLFFGWASS